MTDLYCGLAVKIGDQLVPAAVTMGCGLNMAGLVGRHKLGCGQDHRVFVDNEAGTVKPRYTTALGELPIKRP